MSETFLNRFAMCNTEELKNMETIKCEMCSDSEAICFLDNVNENGEVCQECFDEVYNGHGGYP